LSGAAQPKPNVRKTLDTTRRVGWSGAANGWGASRPATSRSATSKSCDALTEADRKATVGAAYDAYDKQQESARKQAARYRALTAQSAEALTRVARALTSTNNTGATQ